MALVREYNKIEEAVQAANKLCSETESGDVYVVAFDKDIANQVAETSAAKKIGMDDLGIGITLKNVIRSNGEALKMKLEKVGLSSDEAPIYYEKLRDGKILVIAKNKSASI